MSLPDGFQFSQSNLQDYVDCQRRFQLRYLLHQEWPAVEAEPYLENELRIDQGAKFHTIVRQHLIGIPEAQILNSISSDDTMVAWWKNYLQSYKVGMLKSLNIEGSQHYEELTLSIPLNEFRLIAKYDLLIIHPDGRCTIVDWKTSQNLPRRRWLADRLQTHVYPYILTNAGSSLSMDRAVDPEAIEMIYWFTNYPEQPARFQCSTSNAKEDERYLSDLITMIGQKNELIFPLTLDVKRCLFCTYRSLCNRGVKAGGLERFEEWLETEDSREINLNFDQIGEIEF
jgi:hypothetical protein